ncbi:hypothetical protein BDR22DRAFT_492742 [Usnea florida]
MPRLDALTHRKVSVWGWVSANIANGGFGQVHSRGIVEAGGESQCRGVIVWDGGPDILNPASRALILQYPRRRIRAASEDRGVRICLREWDRSVTLLPHPKHASISNPTTIHTHRHSKTPPELAMPYNHLLAPSWLTVSTVVIPLPALTPLKLVTLDH